MKRPLLTALLLLSLTNTAWAGILSIKVLLNEIYLVGVILIFVVIPLVFYCFDLLVRLLKQIMVGSDPESASKSTNQELPPPQKNRPSPISGESDIDKIQDFFTQAFFWGGIALAIGGAGCLAWKWEHPEAGIEIWGIGLITFAFGVIGLYLGYKTVLIPKNNRKNRRGKRNSWKRAS